MVTTSDTYTFDCGEQTLDTQDLWASRLADFVFLSFVFLTLGVLSPSVDVVEFSKLEIRSVVAGDSQSNFINQATWMLLAALASILVLKQPSRFFSAVPLVWPLFLVLVYCLASAAWSQHPELTVRRSVALIVTAYSLLVSVTYSSHPMRPALLCYIAFWVLLVMNIASFLLPVAFDESGYFRGVAGHKNALGATACLAIFTGIVCFSEVKSAALKLGCSLYLAMWSMLLLLSVSKTSIVLAGLVPIAVWYLDVMSRFLRINSAVVLCGHLFFGITLGFLIYYSVGLGPLDIARALYPDVTFTGRTPIWSFMMGLLDDHWLLGIGFGAVWGVGFDAPNLQSIYDYIRLINQAHNGYLDLITSIGCVGFALVLLMLFYGAVRLESMKPSNPLVSRFCWYILLFAIIHNFMESTLLVPFSSLWNFLMIAMVLPARVTQDSGARWRC